MNRFKQQTLMVAAAVLLFLFVSPSLGLASAVRQDATKVHLNASARVHENTVRLRHVADILGPDPDLVMKLGSVIVAFAPPLGKSDILPLSLVREKLERRIWAHGVILEGPKNIEITRAGVSISGEKLKEIGKEYVLKNMPWDPGRVRIESIQAEETMAPEGEISFEITPQKNEDFLGDVVLLITIKVDDKVLKQVWWRADVVVHSEVVVANRYLPRGYIISSGDVIVKTLELGRESKGGFGAPEEVIGKKVKRGIKAGDTIGLGMVEEPPLVQKGDIVTVVAESKLLRVRMKGLAKESGCLGDTIRVVNISSKKEIAAQVTSASEVKVVF